MAIPKVNYLERVPWQKLEPEFLASWGRPNGRVEAQHVAIVGHTGSGKSQLATSIIKRRVELRGSAAIIIATKPADSTVTKLGWPIVREWPPPFLGVDKNHFVFWPKGSKNEKETEAIQKAELTTALRDLWTPGANTIIDFDEIAYLEDDLAMKKLITRYWREARSLGITIVAATQRPRFVSRYMWTESSWVFAFLPQEEDDQRRVAEILGRRDEMLGALQSLRMHEFIVANRITRKAYISKIGT